MRSVRITPRFAEGGSITSNEPEVVYRNKFEYGVSTGLICPICGVINCPWWFRKRNHDEIITEDAEFEIIESKPK